jgi:hypothetical protein
MEHSPWDADSRSAYQQITRLFLQPEGPLPCSQESATEPYAELIRWGPEAWNKADCGKQNISHDDR